MLLGHLPSLYVYHTHIYISTYRNFYLAIFHIQHVCPRNVLKHLPLRQHHSQRALFAESTDTIQPGKFLCRLTTQKFTHTHKNCELCYING